MPTSNEVDKSQQRLVAKDRIKARLNQLDDMVKLKKEDRDSAFRELELYKEFMTPADKQKYQTRLREKKELTSIKLLLDEDE